MSSGYPDRYKPSLGHMVRLARRSGTSDPGDFGVDKSRREFPQHRQIRLAGLRYGKRVLFFLLFPSAARSVFHAVFYNARCSIWDCKRSVNSMLSLGVSWFESVIVVTVSWPQYAVIHMLKAVPGRTGGTAETFVMLSPPGLSQPSALGTFARIRL